MVRSGRRSPVLIAPWNRTCGRFSSARASFDKRRRAHFAQLDSQRKEAVAAKRELISKAEALADLTDWGPTTRASAIDGPMEASAGIALGRGTVEEVRRAGFVLFKQ